MSTVTTGTAADDRTIDAIVQTLAQLPRSPVLGTPDVPYEEVSFPSADGVPLEGWLIPAEGSDRLVIANHPMTFTRTGLPTHLEPWRSIWGPSGNAVEVSFLPDYRILHDAGYTVLAYDLRNHGLSGAANGGIASSGILEGRDVVGALRYVATRLDTRGMPIGLLSRCLGFNATLYAADRSPEEFHAVRCLVGPQPVTERVILGCTLALAGVPAERLDDLDARLRLRTSIGLEPRQPARWAAGVTLPTLLYQAQGDVLTTREDVRSIFSSLATDDKQLHWIEDASTRWDGYLELQRRPEPMLAWFARHLQGASR